MCGVSPECLTLLGQLLYGLVVCMVPSPPLMSHSHAITCITSLALPLLSQIQAYLANWLCAGSSQAGQHQPVQHHHHHVLLPAGALHSSGGRGQVHTLCHASHGHHQQLSNHAEDSPGGALLPCLPAGTYNHTHQVRYSYWGHQYLGLGSVPTECACTVNASVACVRTGHYTASKGFVLLTNCLKSLCHKSLVSGCLVDKLQHCGQALSDWLTQTYCVQDVTIQFCRMGVGSV